MAEDNVDVAIFVTGFILSGEAIRIAEISPPTALDPYGNHGGGGVLLNEHGHTAAKKLG